MKLFTILFVFLTMAVSASTQTSFSDNFNDGNADGWIAVMPSSTYGREPATWRVENQQVVNTPLLTSGDYYKFLFDNHSFFDQSVEARILTYDNGYGGISLWHYDIDNWVDVVVFPGAGYLGVVESVDQVQQNYYFPFSTADNAWYTLDVAANSLTGKLAISVDGSLVATHTVVTAHHSGMSGFESGNGGGAFDDFKLTGTETSSVPEQSSVSLAVACILAVGGCVAIRRRR